MEDSCLTDKILICVDCNEEFVFTIAAQEYFLERGITDDPKRCKSCYMTLKKDIRQQKRDGSRKRTNGYPRHSGIANGNYKGHSRKYYQK
jgi:Probable zinc-ribbon domain